MGPGGRRGTGDQAARDCVTEGRRSGERVRSGMPIRGHWGVDGLERRPTVVKEFGAGHGFVATGTYTGPGGGGVCVPKIDLRGPSHSFPCS